MANQDSTTAPPGLIATLLDGAPFRSNQIHERDRWLIEEAYKAGYVACNAEYEFAAMDLYPPPADFQPDNFDD
jgi:hypothetical protein